MVEILQRAVLTIWGDGGQGTARRNAWASMVADLQHSRARGEAAEALETAVRAADLGALIADGTTDGIAPARAHG